MPIRRGRAFAGHGRYAYVVGASEYGGPNDKSTHGDTGSSGQHLTGKMAFAELEMGHALGSLPIGTQLYITYREGSEEVPVTVTATKLDIGLGGSPVKGHARRIDLWWETAKAINFRGTGLVVIERVDGKPIRGPHDTNVRRYGLGNTVEGDLQLPGEGTAEKAVESVEGFFHGLSLARVVKLGIAAILLVFGLLWLSRINGV